MKYTLEEGPQLTHLEQVQAEVDRRLDKIRQHFDAAVIDGSTTYQIRASVQEVVNWVKSVLPGREWRVAVRQTNKQDFKVDVDDVTDRWRHNQERLAQVQERFFKQGPGPDCFVVAVMNACLFTNREVPGRAELIRIGYGEYGPISSQYDVLRHSGLLFERTYVLDNAIENIGIVTIMHPELNLHAVFAVRLSLDRVLLVNSLLEKDVVSVAELERLVPCSPNNKAWVIR